MRPRIRKIDDNHNEIVLCLRRLGYSVLSLASLGQGAPDILAGKHSKNYLFEIKNGSLYPSQRKLTEDEAEFFEKWRGQISILESIEDVLKFDSHPNQQAP